MDQQPLASRRVRIISKKREMGSPGLITKESLSDRTFNFYIKQKKRGFPGRTRTLYI
jgi:hypothetical protein